MKSSTRILSTALLALLVIVGSAQCCTAQWISKSAIPTFSGRWAALSFALNGKFYLGGGYIGGTDANDFNMYDPATGMWTPKNSLPGTATSRTAGVSFVINGKAYLGLGAQDYNSFTVDATYLSDLWQYDEANDAWLPMASLPDSGRAESAVFVLNGKAYVIGGAKSAWSMTNEVWEYDPAANTWTQRAGYPAEYITYASGFSVNGKGYVVGGAVQLSGVYDNTNRTYQFDATGNSWIPAGSLPDSGRMGGVAFMVNNMVYYGLGTRKFGDFYTDFYTYDDASGIWTPATETFPLSGRAFANAEVIGNKVYAGSGWKLSGGSNQLFFNDFYELDKGQLGIEETGGGAENMICYPNPATDRLWLKNIYGNCAYAIYSVTGERLDAGRTAKDNSIAVGALPAGSYILELESERKKEVTRISIIK